MSKKIFFVCLIIFFVVFLFPITCFAGGDIAAINTIESAFESGLKPISGKLKAGANSLFMALALIQFIWSSYQIALDGKFELQVWVMSILKTIIYISVFRMFVVFGYDWLTEIGNWISGLLGNNSSGISDILNSVFTMSDAPKNALADFMKNGGGDDLIGITEIPNDLKYLGALFVVWLGGLVIAGIMCIAFINAVYIKIKLYVVTCFSVFALGFGGLTYSKDIAINGIKKVISAAVELMVIYALIACANNVFGYFESYKITSFEDSFALTSVCLVAALIFMIMFKALPGDISSMFGGGGGGGGGSLVAAAGAVMGAAASLSHVAGKIAGGAATGTAGSIQAIKEHMPQGHDNRFLGGPQGFTEKVGDFASRLGTGITGAASESFRNKRTDFFESSKNKMLGRNKDNNYGKDYVSPPGGGGNP